jgi:hypothetical protein
MPPAMERSADQEQRGEAEQHGDDCASISGSLGRLVACVERGQADAEQANANGFRSPVRDLRGLLTGSVDADGPAASANP